MIARSYVWLSRLGWAVLLLAITGCQQFERNLHLTYDASQYPTYVLQPVEGIPYGDVSPAMRQLLEDEALAGVAERLDARGYQATLPEQASLNVYLRWWTGQQRPDPGGTLQTGSTPGVLSRPNTGKRIHLQIYLRDAETGAIVWERWSVDDAPLRSFNQAQLDRFLDIILSPLPEVPTAEASESI
ncbi:MAG: hypothetical protein ACFBZ8_10890 [Opitutales bacterium]